MAGSLESTLLPAALTGRNPQKSCFFFSERPGTGRCSIYLRPYALGGFSRCTTTRPYFCQTLFPKALGHIIPPRHPGTCCSIAGHRLAEAVLYIPVPDLYSVSQSNSNPRSTSHRDSLCGPRKVFSRCFCITGPSVQVSALAAAERACLNYARSLHSSWRHPPQPAQPPTFGQ